MTAFGIMQELIENGISIPEDVSVIGFDNIEIASLVNPPLTTIDQSSFETGEIACKMLIDDMNNDDTANDLVIIEPELVIRKSVKELK